MSSYYTRFADIEALVTSTTTATVMASTDAVLVFNVASGKYGQSIPGAIGAFTNVTTSTSTGTLFPNYGLSFVQLGTAGTSGTVFQLADPTARGLVKTVFFSSSSSTATTTVVQSSAVTSIQTTGTTAGQTTITVQGSGAGGWTVTSLSTVLWLLTGKYGTIGTSAS